MSKSFLEFTCSNCDFLGTSMVLWGQMSYQCPRGLIPIEKQLGWCHACRGLVPVEVLPSEERIRFIKHKDYPGFWSILEKTEPLSEDERIKDLEYRRLQRENDLKNERTRLSELVDRKSQPCCLSCGSTAIFAILDNLDPPGSWIDPAPPVPIGLSHPECGGTLLVCHSSLRIAMEIPDRIYDLEGRIVPDDTHTDDEPQRQLDLFDKD